MQGCSIRRSRSIGRSRSLQSSGAGLRASGRTKEKVTSTLCSSAFCPFWDPKSKRSKVFQVFKCFIDFFLKLPLKVSDGSFSFKAAARLIYLSDVILVTFGQLSTVIVMKDKIDSEMPGRLLLQLHQPAALSSVLGWIESFTLKGRSTYKGFKSIASPIHPHLTSTLCTNLPCTHLRCT